MNRDKLPTPNEFKQELQLSVRGEGQFINEYKQPSGKEARREWQRIISEMSNKGLSTIEKKNWIERFLNDVRGTRIVLSFPKLVVHINGQYEQLSKMVEEDQIKNNTSTDHLTSNKNVDPWEQLKDEDVKNRIVSFISGKSYKTYYKFLLSVFELNRDSLQDKNNTAAVELAENQSWYKNISAEPKRIKPKRELIRDYKAEYNER